MARIISITTRRTSNANGAGRYVATAEGRQATARHDYAAPMGSGHAAAARALAERIAGHVLAADADAQPLTVREVDMSDDGGRRTFLAIVGERHGMAARDELTRQAGGMFTRHEHGAHADRLTRENCGACVLGGYGATDDDGPNYAGWARAYVQARRPVPSKWRNAFLAELGETNGPVNTEWSQYAQSNHGPADHPTPYAAALHDDVATWGVLFE